MLCDLNIIFPVTEYNESISSSALKDLKSTINVAHQLGYTHIALNFRPITTTSNNNKVKLPNDLNKLNPINLARDFQEYENKIKIYTRITVRIDDPSQCQNIAKFQQVFDIVAIEPITEKAFQNAIANLDVDLISFNLQERLPCYMKHKTLCSAIEKGILFEIKYTDFLNNKNRAQSLSNTKQIIRASRNRGMIVSSGCGIDRPYQLRNFSNITPILKMIGVDSNRCKLMFEDWSLKVLLNGRLRAKSYKQTIAFSGDDGLIDNKLENKDWESSNSCGNAKQDISAYKKRRTDEEFGINKVLKKNKI